MPTYIQSLGGDVNTTITEPAAVTYDPSLGGDVNTTITEPAVAPTWAASGPGDVNTTITEPKIHNFWTVIEGVKTPLKFKTRRTAEDFVFEPGERDPEGIVGAGIIRDFPTEVITTLTGNVDPDGWVRDKVIMANITPITSIEGFENCYFRGNANWTNNGWLLSGINATAADPVKAYWCTFEPQTPSYYANCIGPCNIEVYFCEMRLGTDLISAFNPNGAAHVKVICSWAHTMVRWAPDTPNGRADTHNDGMQAQGSTGPTDDILIDGSRIDADLHPTLGQPPGSATPNLSAIMLNYGVGGKKTVVTIKNSWLTGGVATINGGDDAIVNGLPGSLLTMDNVVMELRNGSRPQWSLLLDSRLPRSITNVRYTDGSTVPISNG
jgi:hypothetical protein